MAIKLTPYKDSLHFGIGQSVREDSDRHQLTSKREHLPPVLMSVAEVHGGGAGVGGTNATAEDGGPSTRPNQVAHRVEGLPLHGVGATADVSEQEVLKNDKDWDSVVAEFQGE